MNVDDPVVLYIVLRQSLQPNANETAHCAANAIEYLLMRYFKMQLLAVKTNIKTLTDDVHIKQTTSWLASHSQKNIVLADENMWLRMKNEFKIGTDMFCLKKANTENTIVFWPDKYSCIPSYVKEFRQVT